MASNNTTAAKIRTRFLIISDTHALDHLKHLGNIPRQHADVAIHCGDLTQGSQLHEFKSSIQLLQTVDAPLKLVIAGNHDFTMDIPVFKKKVAEYPHPDTEKVFAAYGNYGQARELFSGTGITFLDEGTHSFSLDNGAVLTAYASPYTPSVGDWGFQYHPDYGHDFTLLTGDGLRDIDVVITHGPPRGIFDYTNSRHRAGCPNLFDAVARARPRMHCFGHIHEGWGAKLVTWRKSSGGKASHLTDIDNEQSVSIDKLSEFKRRLGLHGESRVECSTTSHCLGDPHPLKWGLQTLFVNAAIESAPGDLDNESLPLTQPSWLVDLELPAAAS